MTEKIIEVKLEDLIKEIPSTISQRPFQEVKKEYLFLSIEFDKETAIGIFNYFNKRIEIPVGLEFKREILPDYEALTITKKNDFINLGRNEKALYLRLIQSNLEIELIEEQKNIYRKVICLNYPFISIKPFAFYFVSNNKFKGLYLEDEDLLVYNDNLRNFIEEAEKRYNEIKRKSLLNNMRLILPSERTQVEFCHEKTNKPKITKEDKLLEEDIKKLNDWANGKDF